MAHRGDGETLAKRAKAAPDPIVLTSPWSGKKSEVPPHVLAGTCRKVSEFERLNRLGEGTYGVVCKSSSKKRAAPEIVAVITVAATVAAAAS